MKAMVSILIFPYLLLLPLILMDLYIPTYIYSYFCILNSKLDDLSSWESDHSQECSEASAENSAEDDSVEKINAGWADSIAKILRTKKPKRKKTLVLSKAKKITDVKKKKVIGVGFEVETEDGQIKEESIEVEEESKDTIQPRKKVYIC